jgi:hypothetical protein
MNFKHLGGIVLAAGLALGGCTKDIDRTAVGPRARPNWVVRGGGAFKDQSSTVFYGVGIANPMPNIALQRSAAQQRARVEIATTLQTSMRSLVKDFMQHNADLFNPDAKASSQEIISSVSSGVSDAQLDNCRVIDIWEDEKAGTLYALARLDLNDGFYGSYKENLAHTLREKGMTKGMSDADADMKAIDKAIEDQRSHAQDLMGVSQTAGDLGIAPADDSAPGSASPAATPLPSVEPTAVVAQDKPADAPQAVSPAAAGK